LNPKQTFLKFPQLNILPLRRGRVRVAAGSESLWLGEGWTNGSIPPFISSHEGRGDFFGVI